MALAQTLPRDVRERIIAATVLITTGNNDVGSGTLISPQGFILTNYHVIGDLEKRRIAPRLFVGTTRFVDQPPEIRYLADVVATDPNLDLAILRITRTADGQPIGNVTFPAVPIGDSNKLIVGDPIYVFGFKATGGYTITMSTGVVGGFTGEDMESGGKQWIKHDAQIGPGNSGGGAFNGDGELVGINTLLSVSRDGNSRTAFMRPSALAWGLIGPNVTGLVNRAPTASTPQPQPQPQVAASPAWPPALSTGQTWQVKILGGQWTGEWSVVVGGKDADGDFEATAILGSRRTEALFFLQDNILRLNIGGQYPLARCRFDPQSGGGTIQGKLFVFKDANSDAEEIGICVASRLNPQPQQPQAAWPPRLAVGQRWQVSVTGKDLDGKDLNDVGTVTLSERDSDGDPKGTVVFKDGFRMVAYFYMGRSGAALLDMTVPDGDNSHRLWLRCRFEEQGNAASLKGTLQIFRTDANGQISGLKDVGACTATLNR